MRRLQHPNVVDLRHVMSTRTHIYLVLELITGDACQAQLSVTDNTHEPHSAFACPGSLCEHVLMHKRSCQGDTTRCGAATNPAVRRSAGGELFERVAGSGPLAEGLARTFMHQLLDGLAHCHARGVYHRCRPAPTGKLALVPADIRRVRRGCDTSTGPARVICELLPCSTAVWRLDHLAQPC